MRRVLLATALLAAAGTVAAQSHDPAAKAPPASPASASPAVAPAHAPVAAPASVATVASRPGPLVSRITAVPKPTPKAADEPAAGDGHRGATAVTAAAPAKSTIKPLVSSAAGPARHTEAAVSVAPGAKPPAAKGPAKLATVQGRLAAALAEGRREAHAASEGESRDIEPAPGAAHRGRAATPSPARYALTWPKERWRIDWPDVDRVVIAWPK